jgi:hypothetical protein
VHRPYPLDCGKGSFAVDQILHSDGLDDHAQLGCRVLSFMGAEHHARIGVVPEHMGEVAGSAAYVGYCGRPEIICSSRAFRSCRTGFEPASSSFGDLRSFAELPVDDMIPNQYAACYILSTVTTEGSNAPNSYDFFAQRLQNIGQIF